MTAFGILDVVIIPVVLVILATWIYLPYLDRQFHSLVCDDTMSYRRLSQRFKVSMTFALACVAGASIYQTGSYTSYGVSMCLTVALLCLMLALLIDWRTHLIPDQIHVVGLAAAALYVALRDHAVITLAENAAFSFGLTGLLWITTRTYESMRKKPGLGMGDIKLVGWMTILFGSNILYVLVIATMIGLVISLPLLLTKKLNVHQPFAFAPALSLSAIVYLLANISL